MQMLDSKGDNQGAPQYQPEGDMNQSGGYAPQQGQQQSYQQPAQ